MVNAEILPRWGIPRLGDRVLIRPAWQQFRSKVESLGFMPAIARRFHKHSNNPKGEKIDAEEDNNGVRRALPFQPMAPLEQKSERWKSALL